MTIDISWKKLCEDSARIAKDKGWLDVPRSYAGDIILMHSELSEALEDYRNKRKLDEIYYQPPENIPEGTGEQITEFYIKHKKICGIPIELADFIIRVCQYIGTNNKTDVFVQEMGINNVIATTDFEVMLADVHRKVSRAYDHQDTVQYYLSDAVKMVVDFCRQQGIDIASAIFKKQAYNETREYRHGGKKL